METEIRLISNGHIRRHVIQTDKTCRVYDCGFAVACFEEGYETDRGDNWIQAENGFQHCRITGREGSLKPWLIHAYPNTNVLYKNTVIPALFKELEPGETVVETMVEGERNK